MENSAPNYGTFYTYLDLSAHVERTQTSSWTRGWCPIQQYKQFDWLTMVASGFTFHVIIGTGRVVKKNRKEPQIIHNLLTRLQTRNPTPLVHTSSSVAIDLIFPLEGSLRRRDMTSIYLFKLLICFFQKVSLVLGCVFLFTRPRFSLLLTLFFTRP